MRSGRRRSSSLVVLTAAALLLVGCPGVRAETNPPRLADLAWLEGGWQGEAFGGEIEEVWLPARGAMMHGVFRLVVGGRIRISEYLQITEEEAGVILRFAHFRPDYSMVEPAGKPLELRLTAAADGLARFEGTSPESLDLVEYRRQEDGSVHVELTGVERPLVIHRVE